MGGGPVSWARSAARHVADGKSVGTTGPSSMRRPDAGQADCVELRSIAAHSRPHLPRRTCSGRGVSRKRAALPARNFGISGNAVPQDRLYLGDVREDSLEGVMDVGSVPGAEVPRVIAGWMADG